jgi:hypothetical protein
LFSLFKYAMSEMDKVPSPFPKPTQKENEENQEMGN